MTMAPAMATLTQKLVGASAGHSRTYRFSLFGTLEYTPVAGP
jgi:hypothetical protein